MMISITCTTPKAEIRYTLDGSIPTEKSPLYTKPFAIQNSVMVKARAFKKGVPPSFVATQQFTFDYVLSTTFAHKPNTPYNKNASKALYDGELGDVNDLSHGWLGFSGHPMQVDLELAKTIHVSQVVLRFAHVPDAWVFAPAQVEVQLSSDGKVFSDPIPATITYDAAAETMNTTQLQVITIPADREDVRFVRVIARPISHIPQWHRAKGLNPWTMVDEIEIKESLTQ
jgi:hexosaminidase